MEHAQYCKGSCPNIVLKFINSKSFDHARIAEILEACSKANQWANRGPVYQELRDAMAVHTGLGPDTVAMPCANAGIALEGMARLLAAKAGRPLRWVVCDFSFQNLGRGYFADAIVVDSDSRGMLDLEFANRLPPSAWDGLIVVNPFGQAQPKDFEPAIALARDKYLLIDNAAGLGTRMPAWPWQAISLHHTKPYGVGEGGLAIIPTDSEEPLYSLLNYGNVPEPPDSWLNNGKISDIACAYILDRLQRVPDWTGGYFEQAERIEKLAIQVGLTPLMPVNHHVPAMSRAYLAPEAIPIDRLRTTRHATFGKYYKPLTRLVNASDLYNRLVNIPTHPDMAQASDDMIIEDLRRLFG